MVSGQQSRKNIPEKMSGPMKNVFRRIVIIRTLPRNKVTIFVAALRTGRFATTTIAIKTAMKKTGKTTILAPIFIASRFSGWAFSFLMPVSISNPRE
jgi:hypothetical protein